MGRPRVKVVCVGVGYLGAVPDISLVRGASCSRNLAGEGNREPSFCARERMHGIPGHQTEHSPVLPPLSPIAGSGLQEQDT